MCVCVHVCVYVSVSVFARSCISFLNVFLLLLFIYLFIYLSNFIFFHFFFHFLTRQLALAISTMVWSLRGTDLWSVVYFKKYFISSCYFTLELSSSPGRLLTIMTEIYLSQKLVLCL